MGRRLTIGARRNRRLPTSHRELLVDNMRTAISLVLTIMLPAIAGAQIALHSNGSAIAFTHVTIIDVKGSSAKLNMTVVVAGNRIEKIGKTGKTPIPKYAQTIDGSGKFLIPGLWDMHVHMFYEGVPETYFPLFVANGVVGVRDMNGDFPIRRINLIRDSIASGKLVGPRIYASGQLIDGPRPARALGSNVISVATLDEAHRAVRSLKGQGADFIKVYNRLDEEQLAAIADECKKQKITFAGHVPLTVTASEVSDLGQKSIEHLTGVLEGATTSEQRLIELTKILMGKEQPTDEDSQNVLTARKQVIKDYDDKKANLLIRKFAKNGTWQTPTIVSNRVLSLAATDRLLIEDPRLKYVAAKVRQQWAADGRARRAQFDVMSGRYPKLMEIVGKMRRVGVNLLAGTDFGTSYAFAGFSLHDELGLLVDSGLTPLEALQTATINPAKFLGIDDRLGTIAKGKLADMVLLDANPLTDISNTKKIAGVIVNGRFFSRLALDKMLASVETTMD